MADSVLLSGDTIEDSTSEGHGGERLATFDVMKGLLIVGIVIVHLLMLNSVRDTGRSFPALIQPLYLVLMSFFIISGFFYKPERSFKENVKRRVIPLLLVVVACGAVLPVIMYIWMAVVGQPVGAEDLIDSIRLGLRTVNWFGPADSTLPTPICYVGYVNYFLFAMCWAMIVFYAVARFALSDKKRFLITVAVLLGVQMALTALYLELPFSSEYTPIATALMLFGAYLNKTGLVDRLERFEWRTMKFWLPLIVCFVAVELMALVLPPGVKFSFLSFGDYGALSVIPYFIESILVFIVYIYVCLLVSKIPVVSDVSCLEGRHTLGLAMLHVLIAKMILSLFYTFTSEYVFPTEVGTTELLIVAVIDLAIVTAICILGNVLVKKIKERTG